MKTNYEKIIVCITVAPIAAAPTDPCLPSPCGPFSQCRDIGGSPSCTCLPQYSGSPPNCRPECTINTDCPSDKACINERCVDPCPGSCGIYANCRVQSHISICTCFEGYVGDPFDRCIPKVPTGIYHIFQLISFVKAVIYNNGICSLFLLCFLSPESGPPDPCNPSPCGSNAVCRDGVCTCLPEYNGDPYFGCRPECTISSDCTTDKACVKNRCVNPCVQTCGRDALCQVVNHMAVCTCPPKTKGNAFIQCDPIQGTMLHSSDVRFFILFFC